MASEKPVTKPIRKSIKIAARVAQTARFISLMPTPQDFATRICGDVIYMSALIQKFVDDINKVLDGYSNIPFDYLNNQLHSIVDSANNTLNRAALYTESLVDNTLGVAGDIVSMGDTVIDMSVDLAVGSAVMAGNFGAAIVSTAEDIKGNPEVAQSIRDGVQEFESAADAKNKANALKKAATSIQEAENKAKGAIEDTMNKATDAVNSVGNWLQGLINQLKQAVDKMSSDVDKAFGGIVNSKFTDNLGTVANGLQGYDNSMVAQATGAAAGAIEHIIQNFSVGKFITAFLGVATNSLLISTGLNQLPPINFDKMMADFQGKLNEPAIVLEGMEDWQVSFDDLVDYDPEKYNELKESFEELLQQERDSIFNEDCKATLNKNKGSESRMYRRLEQSQKRVETNGKTSEGVDKRVYLDLYTNMDKKTRRELNTAINEIRKKREKAKRANQSRKLKDVVLQELKKLKDECKRFAQRLKQEWEAMLKAYKDAIKQIKDFFHGSGPGDQYVEDLCLDINENCENIKQLCTVDMPMQLTNSSLKAGLPYCFGMAVPNFIHNLVSFIVDLKVILKFIMDLLRYIMNIINDIKKLAQLFLNGLNALAKIIKQIMNLVGLGWLMSLVQSIIDLFKKVKSDTTKMFEATLQPIFLYQFNKYQDYRKEIEKFRDKVKDDSYDADKYIQDNYNHINGLLAILGGNERIDPEEKSDKHNYRYVVNNDFNDLIPNFATQRLIYNKDKSAGFLNEGGTLAVGAVFNWDNESIAGMLDEQLKYIKSIERTYVVAYRSPVFGKDSNGSPDPSQVVDWIYYHPNLKHLGYDIEFSSLDGRAGNYKNYNINSLNSIDDTMDEDFFNTFLEKVASNFSENKDWMHKVTHHITSPNHDDDNWSLFNVDDNETISMYELYYWFRGIDPNDWMALIWPETQIEPGASVAGEYENGSIVRIILDGEPRLVWVKDKNLRQGEWVEVEGKYYKVY